MAIEDLISPLSQDRQLASWQQELLIESLLVQEAPHLALHALRAPGPAIQPLLEIKTLLANNLVAEAFQLQRSKGDKRLLLEFFRGCHEQNKWRYVLDLALTPSEELCLGKFLRSSDSVLGENLHFLYLLQRCKYIEAISFIDQIQNQRNSTHSSDFETPQTILSAYKLTMTPATRQISDIYYSMKDNINSRLNKDDDCTPNPLSSKLLQRKLDLIGGVYHRSVLSTEQTTRTRKMSNLTCNNVPFLRNPQYDMRQQSDQQSTSISYPEEYISNPKRNVNDIFDDDTGDAAQGPTKRRRLNSTQIDSLSKRQNQLTVLTSFKERPSNISFQRLKATPTAAEQRSNTSVRETDDNDTLMKTNLSTPVVKSFKETNKLSPNQYPERVSTPQSILKVKHVNDSPVRTTVRRSLSPYLMSDRRSIESDEKSIRFVLPQPYQNESVGCIQPIATSTVLDPSITMQSSCELDVSAASMLSTSADEYFSPDASQEIAKHKISDTVMVPNKRPNETTPEENISSGSNYSEQNSPLQRRINLGEGPKPRKRLRSSITPDQQTQTCLDVVANVPTVLSLPTQSEKKQNNSELSNTVEIEQKNRIHESLIERRLTRSRSKTPDAQDVKLLGRSSKTPEVELQPYRPLDALKSSTPMRRKPLSRLVLEANAKKATSQLISADDAGENIANNIVTTKADFQVQDSMSLDDTVEDSLSSISSYLLYPGNSQSILSDSSKISESFIERWNNRFENTSSPDNSSINESLITFLHPKDALFSSDSDSSFVGIQKTSESQIIQTNPSPAVVSSTESTVKTVERVIVVERDDSPLKNESEINDIMEDGGAIIEVITQPTVVKNVECKEDVNQMVNDEYNDDAVHISEKGSISLDIEYSQSSEETSEKLVDEGLKQKSSESESSNDSSRKFAGKGLEKASNSSESSTDSSSKSLSSSKPAISKNEKPATIEDAYDVINISSSSAESFQEDNDTMDVIKYDEDDEDDDYDESDADDLDSVEMHINSDAEDQHHIPDNSNDEDDDDEDDDDDDMADIDIEDKSEDNIYQDLEAADLSAQVYGNMDVEYDKEKSCNETDNLNNAMVLEDEHTGAETIATSIINNDISDMESAAYECTLNKAIITESDLPETSSANETFSSTVQEEESNILEKAYLFEDTTNKSLDITLDKEKSFLTATESENISANDIEFCTGTQENASKDSIVPSKVDITNTSASKIDLQHTDDNFENITIVNTEQKSITENIPSTVNEQETTLEIQKEVKSEKNIEPVFVAKTLNEDQNKKKAEPVGNTSQIDTSDNQDVQNTKMETIECVVLPSTENTIKYEESNIESEMEDVKTELQANERVVCENPVTTIDENIKLEILNNKQPTIDQKNVIETIALPSSSFGTERILRKTRARTISIDSPQIQLGPATPIRRSTRATSTEHTTPMESPLSSRKVRGRSEPKTIGLPKKLILAEENTPNKIRTPSKSVANKEHILTPLLETPKRKSRRGSQNESPDNVSVASSQQSTRTTRSSLKHGRIFESPEDNVSIKSGKSGKSGKSIASSTKHSTKLQKKNVLPPITEEGNIVNRSEGNPENYAQTRRLTRYQKHVMEKNMGNTSKVTQRPSSTVSISDELVESDNDDEISDGQSMVSKTSHKSTLSKKSKQSKRSTRKKVHPDEKKSGSPDY